MAYPNLWKLEDLLKSVQSAHAIIMLEEGGTAHVPARPLGYASFWSRVRLAWLVFTGKADAVKWPYQ